MAQVTRRPSSEKRQDNLKTKSRPRSMRKLPLELHEKVHGRKANLAINISPRTIEVKFMYTEEAEAYAEAVKNTRPSMNQYKQREYK
ncbi:uncharacterized protein RSE6_08152 [Rhynchosporium secalis]|uniref:Uncharacterized protein n=1 Tax=Rhynchosporium secalis TaxID=38038 RepID=A0A1E1MEP6_RHYSE|nr:uncharacterized protein RSE6_08152 [Rhynchosporium secalis]